MYFSIKKIHTLAIAGVLVPLGFHPNHLGSSNLASSLCYTHYWSYRPTAHFHFKECLGSTKINYLCWTNVTPGAGKIMVDCEFGFLGFSWRRVKSWRSCRTIAKCSLNKVKVIHTIEKSIIHPKTEKKKAPSQWDRIWYLLRKNSSHRPSCLQLPEMLVTQAVCPHPCLGDPVKWNKYFQICAHTPACSSFALLLFALFNAQNFT